MSWCSCGCGGTRNGNGGGTPTRARNLKVSEQPAVEPVSLEEALHHLRVDEVEDENEIWRMIRAARMWAQGFQDRTYAAMTWDVWLNGFPSGVVELPRPPLIAVLSITAFDEDDVETVVPETAYRADPHTEPGTVRRRRGETWPNVQLRESSGVRIRYRAGHEDVDVHDISDGVKDAVLIKVGDLYANREDILVGTTSSNLDQARALLWQDRTW